jgi:hypothetical protein
MNKLVSLAFVIVLAGLAASPAAGSIVYDNTTTNDGPYTGNAWTLNDTFSVADSFNLTSSNEINANIWLWELDPTEDLTSLPWEIVSGAYSSDPFTDTVVASGTDLQGSSISSSFVQQTTFDDTTYYIFEEQLSLTSAGVLSAGQYFLILGGEAGTGTSDANPVYWDQSDGASAAWGSSGGDLASCGEGYDTTCSESFQLESAPEPSTTLLLATGLIGLGLFRRRKNHA